MELTRGTAESPWADSKRGEEDKSSKSKSKGCVVLLVARFVTAVVVEVVVAVVVGCCWLLLLPLFALFCQTVPALALGPSRPPPPP